MQVAEIQAEKTQEFNERLLGHLHRGGAFGFFQFYHATKTYIVKNKKTKKPIIDPKTGKPKEAAVKSSMWFEVGKAHSLAKIQRNIAENHVYFGVHPSTLKRTRNQRSIEAEIAAINCHYSEIDAKDFDGDFDEQKQAAKKHVDGYEEFPPSVIIDSWGGYQNYWLFRDTIPVDDGNREQMAKYQRAWVDYTGGDDGAKDLARILRLPGTLNHKPKYGTPRPVKYVKADFDLVYDAVDLWRFLDKRIAKAEAEAAAWAAEHAEDSATYDAGAIPADDSILLERMKNGPKSGAKFRALWDGNISAYDGNQSRADSALAFWLAFWTGSDQSRMDGLFRQSSLYRPKWDMVHYADGATYGQRTIERAAQTVTTWYNPRSSGTDAGAVASDGQGQQTATNPTVSPSQNLMGELDTLGYTFRQNELDDVIFVGEERLDNGLAAKIKTQIRDRFNELAEMDAPPSWRVTWLEDAYTAAAYDSRFHPVRDYLNSLEWDQKQYNIRNLANHFTGTDEPIVYTVEGERAREYTLDVFYVYLRKWMIGTVAKALNPSAQTQVPMLVIVGKQGDGKSTFAQWLGSPLPELTIESAIQPDNPEHSRYLSTKWLWEVAELGATTRRADVEALKAFITKVDSTYRKPYDKHPITKPALSSFIGTVNDGIGFLNDISGNRRFHVARVANIDWDYIENIDINQLWAEAVHAYRDGEPWQLGREEVAHRDKLNSQHETEDALEGWILKYFEIDATEQEWLTQSSEIVQTIQSMGVTGGTKTIQNGVASYLKRRGLTQHWERPRKWIGIKPQDWVIRLREDAKKKD